MLVLRLCLVSVLSLLLIACNGRSSDSSPHLQGRLSKAPIHGAICNIFSLSGELLAAVETTSGDFRFQFTSLPFEKPRTETLRIECTGGSYIDEATGTQIDATGFQLRALIESNSGKNNSLGVTPLTEIAFALAEADGDLSDYSEYLQIIFSQLGLSGEYVHVLPTDPQAGTLDPAIEADRYALVLFTLSQMASERGGPAGADAITEIISEMVAEIEQDGELFLQSAEFYKALDVLGKSDSGAGASVGAWVVNRFTEDTAQSNLPQGYSLNSTVLVSDSDKFFLDFGIDSGGSGNSLTALVYSDAADFSAPIQINEMLGGSAQSFRIPLDELPDGRLTLMVRLNNSSGAGEWVTFTIGDTDEDGVSDLAELRTYGTDPQVADTGGEAVTGGAVPDSGAVTGAEEISPGPDAGALSQDDDSDGDGINDLEEVTTYGTSHLLADTDGDGINDPDELFATSGHATSATLTDTDNDGLDDLTEIQESNTDPANRDTDGDGYDDGQEVNEAGTDPNNADTDADTLNDGEEVSLGSNPLLADSDSDGVNDSQELADGTDPINEDSDQDGLDDGGEITVGSNPLLADSDNDGISDGREIAAGTNALLGDTDGDGLSDFSELDVYLSNPLLADTDGDLWDDGFEVSQLLNPLLDDRNDDLDKDGLSNIDEITLGTVVANADSDDDGVPDGQEQIAGTDPLDVDTDKDGLGDGEEIALASNPLNVDTDGDGIPDQSEPERYGDTDGDGLNSLSDTDSDGDGVPDQAEQDPFADLDGDSQINMLDDDADGDGIGDGVEVAHGLDPRDASDAELDLDTDGLGHRAELRIGTDINKADTDDDGLDDGTEINVGLDPLVASDAIEDADRDGLSNILEISLGTDLYKDDSDDDGLSDNIEHTQMLQYGLTAPTALAVPANPGCSIDAITLDVPVHFALNPDSDDDGVVDGVESGPTADLNGDGVIGMLQAIDRLDCLSDKQVIDNELTAIDGGDSDGDGLSDGREFILLGSNPHSKDTDGDSLTDYHEVEIGCYVEDFPDTKPNLLLADTDGDGLNDGVECGYEMNPVSQDTDGDGFLDNEEFRLCEQTDIDAGVPCTLGELYSFSNPRHGSEDGDGIPDGVDYDFSSVDSDGDGLDDGEELSEGYNLSSQDFTTTDGVAFVPATLSLPVTDYMAGYRVVVKVLPQTIGQTVNASISGLTGDTVEHAVHPHGAQFVMGPVIPVNGQGEQTITLSGNNVRVERVFLMGLLGNSELYVTHLRSFGNIADSDGDGLLDGQETQEMWWMEAEDYSDSAYIQSGAESSNGQFVSAPPADFPATLFAATLGITEPRQLPEISLPGNATFYVRARVPEGTPTTARLVLQVEERDFFGMVTGTRELTLSNITEFYNWQLMGTVSGLTYHSAVLRLIAVDAAVELDQIMINGNGSDPRTYTVNYNSSSLSAEQKVLPPYDNSYQIEQTLPYGVTHPMSADTDGDGWRHHDGTLPGSAGWLTDGHEMALRLNSFNTDSDSDVSFAKTAAGSTATLDDFAEILWDGSVLSPQGVSDGRADYGDASDPSPATFDFDRDGLQDELEIELELDFHRQACAVSALAAGDLSCDSAETCTSCAATDFDELADLPAYCRESLTQPGNLPLCAYADDDWDDDGIADGVEDANRNGVVDPAETSMANPDTDADCVGDGIELGYTCPAAFDTLVDPTRIGYDVAECPGFLTVAEGFGRHPGFRGAKVIGQQITNPVSADTDSDGVLDGITLSGVYGERNACDGSAYANIDGQSSAVQPDTDSDALDDYAERVSGTNPDDADSDSDGLWDGQEVYVYNTNPLLSDTDGDGLDDSSELSGAYGVVLDPLLADTDGDGLSDSDELYGQGALASCNMREFCGTDTQLDDATLNTEAVSSSCQILACAVGSGLCGLPASCSFGRTSPVIADSDGDGLSDGDEVTASVRSNPNVADTDGDGLSDGDEINGTGMLAGIGSADPTRTDSDGDAILDTLEARFASVPSDFNDRPQQFELRPGGLVLDLTLAQVVDSNTLRLTGRQELRIGELPLGAAFDGQLTITRTGKDYQLTGNGDLIALEGSRETVLWSGETSFSDDSRTALPGVTTSTLGELPISEGLYFLDFSLSDACLASAGCTDRAGPDAYDLSSGTIIDSSARVRIPASTMLAQLGNVDLPSSVDQSSLSTLQKQKQKHENSEDPIPMEDQVIDMANIGYEYGKQALIAEQTQWNGLSAPDDFPWEGRECIRQSTPVKLGMELLGQVKLKVNPDLSIGQPPSSSQPAFSLGGLGAPRMPVLSHLGLAPLGSSLKFDPSLGHFVLSPDADFDVALGRLNEIGGEIEPLIRLQAEQQDNCLIDVAGGRYSCKYSAEKEGPKRDENGNIIYDSNGRAVKVTKYKYRGRLDISEHGLIPFQTVERLNFEGLTYNGLPVADQIDLCQDGQISFEGAVIIPIKKIPKLSVILTGLMVSDVVNFTSPIDGLGDGDGLFTGVFGTVWFGIDEESEDLPVELPIPLKLEVADAVAAMIFDDEGDLLYIAFDSVDGWRIRDKVEPPNIGLVNKVVDELEAEKNHLRGIIDVNTGRIEGNMTIRPHNLRIDAQFVQTQPVDDAGNTDQSRGSIEIQGSSTIELPDKLFPSGSLATVSGTIFYNGDFLYVANASQNMLLPGLPQLELANTRLVVDQDGLQVSGSVDFPGLGALNVAGGINTAGGYYLTGQGSFNPLGFQISGVSATLSDASGMRWSGTLHLPALAGGGVVQVAVSGWYKNAQEFGFSSNHNFGMNINGYNLLGMSASGSPSGVTLGGVIALPYFHHIGVYGGINAGGGIYMTGSFNQAVGPVRLAYSTLYVQRGNASSGLQVSANSRVELAGRMHGDANIGIAANGSFNTYINMGLFGQTINMQVLKDGQGTATYVGSTNVGVTVPIINEWVGAGLVVTNENGMRIRAQLLGQTLDVDGAGCIGLSVRLTHIRLCAF